MRIFNYQANILMILFSNLSTVNGSVFSDYIGQSLKTIRKEIDDLNIICHENGCNIISHPGSGYEMEVTDRKKYRDFRAQVEKRFKNGFFYEDMQDERIHFIIRRFLCKRSLYINDLIDMCNCSESSIRRDMNGIKKILSQYKLTLINRTNKGMSLEGDEWHIRLAFIRENYYHIKMDRVYFLDDDEEFIRMLCYSKETLRELDLTIRDILTQHHYYLSYLAIERFAVLFCICVIRIRKEEELLDRFNDLKMDEEKVIIQEILKSFRLFNRIEFSAKTLSYLSIMLRGSRMLKYNSEFLFVSDRDEIQSIVDGFFTKLRSIYDLHDSDVSVLYKDLCGAVHMLKYRCMIDVHEHEKNINEFIRDALYNLDLTTLLYLYLKNERGFDCDQNDVAVFYHAFLNFSIQRNEAVRRRVMVISSKGYFYARTIANLMNDRKNTNLVEFVPIEYMRFLEEKDLKYHGIYSDIDELKGLYPEVPFSSLNLQRTAKRIGNIAQFYILSKSDFTKVFPMDNLYYAKDLDSEEKILEYVKSEALKEYEHADSFVLEAKIKAGVYGNFKINNCYVVSAFNDYLKDTFVKIVCLDKTESIGTNKINKILIFNFKNNDMYSRSSVMNLISRILHSYNSYITYDRNKDYRNFVSLMYGDI